MNHLDEFQLNEYLDGQLDEAEKQAVETHLATCGDCRAALADLQALFLALDEVGEVALTTDLSARVLTDWRAQSTPEPTPWLRPLLALQLAATMGMAVWLWPVIAGWLGQLETALAAIQPVQLGLGQRLMAWETAVLRQFQAAHSTINLATGQWALLIGLALLAWLAGNRLILNDDHGTMNDERRIS